MLSSVLILSTLTGAAFASPPVGVVPFLPATAFSALPDAISGGGLVALSDSLPDNSVSGPLIIVPPVPATDTPVTSAVTPHAESTPESAPEPDSEPDEAIAPTPQAALRVTFGGAVDEETALRVAEHAVRVVALEQAARRLSRKPGVRLFAGDIPRLMALSAPLLSLDMQVGAITSLVAPPASESHILPPAHITDDLLRGDTVQESAPCGELRATAHWEQYRSEDDFLHELITTGQSLDSQALAYAQSRRLTAECLRLLRDAATLRRAGGDEAPQADRLAVLLPQLDDLNLFLRGPFPPEAAKLERLLARNPGNPAYLIEYAELLLRSDQPSKALDVLKSLSGSPRISGQIFYLRGLAHLALRLPALAHKDFSRAIRLNPEAPGYWQGRALAFAALDDTPRMCADMEQACSLGLCEDLERVRLSGYCRK